MAVTTPSFTVQWASGAAPGDVQYPTAGVEATGYLDGQPLPHEEFNGIVQRLGNWTVWLEDIAGDDSSRLKFGSTTANGLDVLVDTSDVFIMRIEGPAANTGALTTGFVNLTGAAASTGLPEFTIMSTGPNGAAFLRSIDNVSLTDITFVRASGGTARFTSDTLRAENVQARTLNLYETDFDPANNLVDLAVSNATGRAVIETSSPNAEEVSLLINHVELAAFNTPAGEVLRINGGSGEDLSFEYALNLPTDYNRLEVLTEGTRPTIFAVDNLRLDGVIDLQSTSGTLPLVSIGQFTRTVSKQNICRAKALLALVVNGSGEYNAPLLVGDGWNVDTVAVQAGGQIRINLVDPATAPVVSGTVHKDFVESTTGLSLLNLSGNAGFDSTGAWVEVDPAFLTISPGVVLQRELARTGLTPGDITYVSIVVH